MQDNDPSLRPGSICSCRDAGQSFFFFLFCSNRSFQIPKLHCAKWEAGSQDTRLKGGTVKVPQWKESSLSPCRTTFLFFFCQLANRKAAAVAGDDGEKNLLNVASPRKVKLCVKMTFVWSEPLQTVCGDTSVVRVCLQPENRIEINRIECCRSGVTEMAKRTRMYTKNRNKYTNTKKC